MQKKFFVLVLISILAPAFLLAQHKTMAKKAPVKVIEQTAVQYAPNQSSTPGGMLPSAEAWVAVDTMPNALGPAISSLNVVAYDPYANVAAVVHRGKTTYAKSSGEIWYNLSTDGGKTWKRSPTSIQNGAIPNNGRYPSMTLSNPTKSANIADVTGIFTWPQLNPSAFGYMGYGADQPIGGGSPYAVEEKGPPAFSSQVPCWASDNSTIYYWIADNQTDASLTLFVTDQFTSVTKSTPAQWNDAAFRSNGNIMMGGACFNGVSYVGALGSFADTTKVAANGWGVGYSKSTDNGKTWSNWKLVDWWNIPATKDYDRLWDYIKGDQYISYCGDINVDKNGMVHLVTGLTKNADTAGIGYNALVEFIETATGWDAKIISEGALLKDKTFTQIAGEALGQMGPSPYLAVSKDRDFFVCQWVTGSTETADSLCDIYMASRTATGNWSTRKNVTSTTNLNENATHLAPFLQGSAGSYTAFSFYDYEAGVTTYNANSNNPAVIYIAPVKVTTTGVEGTVKPANSYRLDQNYPNPFNPSTTISYAIPERSNVKIVVSDMLGREVATLVNGVQNAGNHEVVFNASNLSSGMYIYTITTNSFSTSKKMMLMK